MVASLLTAMLVTAGIALGCSNSNSIGVGNTGSSRGYVEGVGQLLDLMPVGPRGLNAHVSQNQTVSYSTLPPTSGDHWGTPAICGFYEGGLPDESIVHNLEHGNIVVSYNLATPEEVDQLKEVVDDIGLSPIWGVTRFYDKLPVGTVAVAAWDVLDSMQGVDGERIDTFYQTYAGLLGPESIIC